MRSIFILLLGLSIHSLAQTYNECTCPKNHYAGTEVTEIFPLKNQRIALCGYVEVNNNEKRYSEFVLAVCGQDKIIDFWDALTVCKITSYKDTLRIEELKNLPTGRNLEFVPTVWRIEEIYFKGTQVQKGGRVNRQIRKYNQREITTVLAAYQQLNRKLSYDDMDLIYKLFMAVISGNKIARKYLTDKTKFEILDGAFAEDYKELIAMLDNWEAVKKG